MDKNITRYFKVRTYKDNSQPKIILHLHWLHLGLLLHRTRCVKETLQSITLNAYVQLMYWFRLFGFGFMACQPL